MRRPREAVRLKTSASSNLAFSAVCVKRSERGNRLIEKGAEVAHDTSNGRDSSFKTRTRANGA